MLAKSSLAHNAAIDVPPMDWPHTRGVGSNECNGRVVVRRGGSTSTALQLATDTIHPLNFTPLGIFLRASLHANVLNNVMYFFNESHFLGKGRGHFVVGK